MQNVFVFARKVFFPIFAEKSVMERKSDDVIIFLLKSALGWGIWTIIGLSVLYFIYSEDGLNAYLLVSNTKLFFLILATYSTLRNLNEKKFQNSLKFFQIFGYGILFVIFFSFYDGLFFSVLFSAVDNTLPDKILKMSAQTFPDTFFSQTDIQAAEAILRRNFIIWFFFGNIFSNILTSLIFLLPISLFLQLLKRRGNEQK